MIKLSRWIGILGIAIMPSISFAQTSPTIDEKAQFLMEATEAQKNFDLGIAMVKPLLLKQFQATSKKITPELANYILQIFDEETSQMKPAIMAFLKDYLKRSYSEEEIGALYDFYKTPVGARLASKTNSVIAGAAAESQVYMQRELIPRFKDRLEKDAKLREALRN